MTEAQGCEQLAQSCYLIAGRPDIELTTSRSLIGRSNHYATKSKSFIVSLFSIGRDATATALYAHSVVVFDEELSVVVARAFQTASLVEELVM